MFPKTRGGIWADVRVNGGEHFRLLASETGLGPASAVYDMIAKKWISEPKWADSIEGAQRKAEDFARTRYLAAGFTDPLPAFVWIKGRGGLEEKQAIQLLWCEWKYRHDLFWKLLFKFAGAVIVLWIIPFLKPEVFRFQPWIALAFPAAAVIMSLFSAWVLAAEQKRFEMVNKKYDELRIDYLPPRMPKISWRNKLVAARIGAWIVILYGIGFAFLSGVVGYFLYFSIKTPTYLIRLL
jgi:hypothetical protein